ncbi:hypothetical protein GQ44DRAFT_578819, partial [Phaeosphaeriaceae sp. PMI808]
MHSHITFLSAIATLFAIALGQQCYGVDGTKLDDTFAPCNPTANHSGCCATKRSSGADLCLDNGLCMSTRGEFMGMIWQNGCTDATGKDVACLKICPDSTNNIGGLNPVSAWNVQQCDYGKFCCRAANDRRSCCNNTTSPKITTSSIGAFQVQTSTATSTSSTPQLTQVLGTAVSTGSPFTVTTAPSSNNCQKEKQQTAVVGSVIGGLFGVIILFLASAMLWMHKKE